jgi:dolichyl-diphosphooligosaccharide--protein glycosyltransferase
MRRLVPLALFLGALALRAIGWREVVGGDHVLPVDADSWYHLRRIAYSIHSFPAMLDFDPYLNYPAGAKPIWTPVFDWSAALLLRPFVGTLTDGGFERLELLAMWLPPLLGAVTVWLAYRLALRHFGGRGARRRRLAVSAVGSLLVHADRLRPPRRAGARRHRAARRAARVDPA